MKIIGLTRIRNESEIILDTLKHMKKFCDEIYVFDDSSTDNTIEICENSGLINGIFKNTKWDSNRAKAEFQNRQELLTFARKSSNIKPDDWFIYMDADERIDFDFKTLEIIDKNVSGIKMRLFDFYITEEDKNLKYTKRKWIGPEYRDILFLFKNKYASGYTIPDQRECSLKGGIKILKGFVKHYGKSISIKQWEDTCEYYSKHFPRYSKKWETRKGKAIHNKSDFGRALIKWEDKEKQKIFKIH